MANIYRIRIPSGYDAQLVGVPGTPTEGQTIQGNYNQTYDMHEFPITITGRYKLFMKQAGEQTYEEQTTWGGDSGKLVMGDDFDVHFNGHGKGEDGKIKPEETTFAEPI